MMLGDRYADEDEYRDAVREAREDAYWDAVEEHGLTCEDCGEMWDPGHVPATRHQPAEVRQDCCPRCGGGPKTDDRGWPLVGRQPEEDDDG